MLWSLFTTKAYTGVRLVFSAGLNPEKKVKLEQASHCNGSIRIFKATASELAEMAYSEAIYGS
ncbi:hypothetical protein BpHYR1_045127 [Brachionus plicatilis]|uniref:Uncharacterized protein n=1 Tax=Brachionus plicatilis TaxID=10195 RepID=A0A3M7PH93_BRAPC|nr:hypothetical protein BpHYR1_045127 [Brachionus plicatilis]